MLPPLAPSMMRATKRSGSDEAQPMIRKPSAVPARLTIAEHDPGGIAPPDANARARKYFSARSRRPQSAPGRRRRTGREAPAGASPAESGTGTTIGRAPRAQIAPAWNLPRESDASGH